MVTMAARFESLDRLARQDPALQFRSDKALGVVSHLRGHLGHLGREPERMARSFLAEHQDLFGEVDSEGLVIHAAEADPAGGTNVIFEQRHTGHRVLDGSIRFHVGRDGELDTVSNRLFPDLAGVPRQPRIDAEQAVAALHEETHSRAPVKTEPEAVVVRHDGRPYLAWEVRLDLDPAQHGDWAEPTQWAGYVDTATGRVLYCYNNFQTAGAVVGSGTGVYSGTGSLNTWYTGTTYELRDTTRAPDGPEIRTDDEDGTSPSTDPDNNWNTVLTNPRDANQGAEVDAHRYAGIVADYYHNVHGRHSFDDHGAAMINLVHYGTDYSNGGWNGSQVRLGDGSGVAPGDNYETSDDWLAHEWTHAVTEHTCGLEYYAEAGALNEAFSDTFAAFITGDWLVFEDTWLKKSSAPAWRNMMDPTNGGKWDPADPINKMLDGHQPSHYSVRYTGPDDHAGVHINSGIINNLFYLLTVGGTHTVSGVTVSGIGQLAAESMLWRCMTVNLVTHPKATFLDFREAMLDACLDLFPTDLFKLAQVKAAFNAVGIGPDIYVRDNLADTGAEPYTGTYLYASPDVINRTNPSPNPSVEFADLGNDSLWQNIKYGQENSIYIRLQNRGPADGDATINVYLATATTFGTPAVWQPIGTLTAAGIAPGAMEVVGPLPFPAAQIPAPGHYCMIAVVSSSLDPAPDHTLINTVPAYLDYVRDTNNIAYRNMDVDGLVPGKPGKFEFVMRGIGHDVEQFSVRFDDALFVPGARVRIIGPARLLRGALPRGLKLKTADNEQAVFEMLAGNERLRHFDFVGRDSRIDSGLPGFDRLRIEGEAKLQVEYKLPDRQLFEELHRLKSRGPFTLAVRQYWNGEVVGSIGIRLQPRK
jgi:neutral peptidase B